MAELRRTVPVWAWFALGAALSAAASDVALRPDSIDFAASTAPPVISTQAARMRKVGSAKPATTRISVDSSGAA